MPLDPGKSRAAFAHNVEAEMKAGKSQKQAVAIAYSEQRRTDSDKFDEILLHCDAFDCGMRADEHIGWDAMVKKLMEEGHSKESAERIAGYINKQKNG